MKYLFAFLAIFMIAAAPVSSQSRDETAESFKISLSIYDGSTLVGQPVLTALAGAEVIMASATPEGYTVRATVRRDPSDVSQFILNTEVHFASGAEWRRAGEMQISGRIGGMATREESVLTPRGNARYKVVATVEALPGMVPVAARQAVKCPVYNEIGAKPLKGVMLPTLVRIRQDEEDTGPKTCCQNNHVVCCISGCCSEGGSGCCVTSG